MCLTLHTELETSLLRRLVNSLHSSWPPPSPLLCTHTHYFSAHTLTPSLHTHTHSLHTHTHSFSAHTHTRYSIDCYTVAQAVLPSPYPSSIIIDHHQHLMCDKLGNAWNELGVYYMHVAASLDFASGEIYVSPAESFHLPPTSPPPLSFPPPPPPSFPSPPLLPSSSLTLPLSYTTHTGTSH